MSQTLNLTSITKEITLLPYTRRIARAVNEKLLEGVIVKSGELGNETEVPAINADRAEELGIKLISGLSQPEMDELSIDDYNAIKEAFNEATQKKTETPTK